MRIPFERDDGAVGGAVVVSVVFMTALAKVEPVTAGTVEDGVIARLADG